MSNTSRSLEPAKITSQGDSHTLSIGDLARETGVAVGTLRMWETRHGFPSSRRTPAGHRRYDASQVALVREVEHRREGGARLDAAIAAAATGVVHTGPDSVYAALTRQHPTQPRQQLRKSTLLGLSWACEDEIVATAARGHLFGAFQNAGNFEGARARWEELARTSRTAFALADFPDPEDRSARGEAWIERVSLSPDAPMRREWAVVNDSPELPLALTAWELPGQGLTAGRDRLFETVWTMDPHAVRTASRACAAVAAAAHSSRAAELLEGALAAPPPPPPDPLTVGRLVHRIIAYIEAASRRS